MSRSTYEASGAGRRPGLLRRIGLGTWRGRLGWMGGLLTIVVLGALVCLIMLRATPSWYQPMDPNDQGVVDADGRAESILIFGESNLQNIVQRVPLGEQRWTISQDELNAFLAVHTASPFNSDGQGRVGFDPVRNPISEPYVIFGKGEVTICARVTKLPSKYQAGGVGTLVYSVNTVAGADGRTMGQVQLKEAYAGYLPVPKSSVQARLQALVPALQDAAIQAAHLQAGERSIKSEPILREMIAAMMEGRPFPLQFDIDKKEFFIKELTVEPGRFSMVLAPLKPAAVPPRTLPVTPLSTRPQGNI